MKNHFRPVLAIALAVLLVGGGVLLHALTRDGAGPGEMVVYKTPDCGCCDDWIDHMDEAGFPVTGRDITHAELNDRKRESGLPPGHASCHTAFIDDYVIEGHVPARDVRRLLEERPDGVVGLTVPGMPVGSPGMEYGDRQDPYDVLSFREDGTTDVFASYHQ